MTNISSSASIAEEGPLVPEQLPTEPRKSKPAWRSLNFGPRMWISLGIIGAVAVIAFIGPLFYPFAADQKVGSLYDAPSAQHILGTENFGYDVLAVLMASTRNSLVVGLLAGTTAVLIGVAIGILAGYVGGWLEELLMGVTNIVLAIPSIVILILISIALQRAGLDPSLARARERGVAGRLPGRCDVRRESRLGRRGGLAGRGRRRGACRRTVS